jgi:TPR repeat protein
LLKTGWVNLNPEKENISPFLIEAAQAGLPTAQFSVGFYTLRGLYVTRDRAKGLRWLELAANKGHHDAEVMLATELLRVKPDAADVARARELLEKAAAADHANAKYFLADLLLEAASAPADPRRSLELLGDVMKDLEDDPSAYEVRAAALSQTGAFEGAIAAQKRAVAKARKLDWDVAPQEERLALYTKGQPWTRRLLDY